VGIEEGKGAAWLDSAEGLPEVKGQLQTAVELGITSVPTFVFNRSIGVAGAQPPEVFVRTMERAIGGS